MKLLLHICCGPCAVYPVSAIREEGIEFEGLFFNPNIHPIEEFVRRKENVEKLSAIKDFNVTFRDEFMQKEWESYENQNVSRCNMCYILRLEEAAKTASIKGFEAFTTTLLVSPYQNHDLIQKLGEDYALKYGVEFYYRDFRSGFRKGQQEAKDLGLYRQKYCGCIMSLSEANSSKK